MVIQEIKRNLKPGDYTTSVNNKLTPVYKYVLPGKAGTHPYAYMYDGIIWVAHVDEVLGRVIEVEKHKEYPLNNLI